MKYTSQEEAMKGHLNLQKTLGSERVVWPKDQNDEAWGEIYSKLGVPGSADEYGLQAADLPNEAGSFDRLQFQGLMKEHNIPKSAAEGLWGAYTEMQKGAYTEAENAYKQQLDAATAQNRQEWGEAYQTNLDRGLAVINSFARNDQEKQALEAEFGQNPALQALLARTGKEFSEAKIGGFQTQATFRTTPEEAQKMIDEIKAHPDYTGSDVRKRQPLLDRIMQLREAVNAQ
jgi:hypothetical protein